LIAADPTIGLATADCDGGGVPNNVECFGPDGLPDTADDPATPTDPLVAGDDCQSALDNSLDVCALIAADPTIGLATADCDGGGVANNIECFGPDGLPGTADDPATPTNPLVEGDDCQSVIDNNLDLCSMLENNPNSGLATSDCDGGGIINSIECQFGGDFMVPQDDCQLILDKKVDVCTILATDPDNPLASEDCDGDGISNAQECSDGTNPTDPCSNRYPTTAAYCNFILSNPTSMLALADCDGGGVSNLLECQHGYDLLIAGDDCALLQSGVIDICAILETDISNAIGALDCDEDGKTNAEECAAGTNPIDPCSVDYPSMVEICYYINSHPSSSFALADCDEGGITNIDECTLYASLPSIPGLPLQNIFDNADDCEISCDMQCISQINLSLRETDCAAELLPSMVLPGVGESCDFSPLMEVVITDDHGNLLRDEFGNPTNRITIDHLGQNLEYKITNNLINPMTGEACGNTCWGNVLVEYKHLPQIDCPDDLTLSCGALDVLPLPNVAGEGACSVAAFEVYLADEQRNKIECGDPGAESYTHIVTRTYVATDALGNTSSCSHTIMLERIDLGGLEFPENAVVNCSELDNFKLADNGVPIPWVTAGLTGSGSAGVPVICHPGMLTTTGLVCPSTGSGTGIPLIPQSGATVLSPDGPEMVMGDVVGNCSAAIIYTDLALPQIGCTRKVLRTWEIREWYCGLEIPVGPYVQQIEIKDDMAPVITCPEPFVVTTNDDCAGNISLASAVATDGCDNGINVTIEHPWGIVEGNGGTATLEVGTHILTYKVKDNCGNVSDCVTTVTVRDNTEPVAICEQSTVVSISQDGNTFVSSAVLDDGSWDECGDITSCAMKVEDVLRFRSLGIDLEHNGISYVLRSRMDNGCLQDYVEGITLGGEQYISEDDLCVPYLRFCCVDAGQDQMVVFRAKDHGGNQSDCMVTVEVQDKAIPQLECPADQTIDCRIPYALDNLSLQFGTAVVADNCAANQEVKTDYEEDVNQCGIGTITRLFEIEDDLGQVVRSCKQQVKIVNETPFNGDIEWPLNFEATCGLASGLAPEQVEATYGNAFSYPRFPVGSEACSLLGFDYEDKFFAEDPLTGQCGVIRRSWTVIDWCNSVGGEFVTYPLGGPYVQTIKIENNVAPTITPQDNLVFSSNSIDCSSGEIEVVRTATDDCTAPSDIRWSYTLRASSGAVITEDMEGNSLGGGQYKDTDTGLYEWTIYHFR